MSAFLNRLRIIVVDRDAADRIAAHLEKHCLIRVVAAVPALDAVPEWVTARRVDAVVLGEAAMLTPEVRDRVHGDMPEAALVLMPGKGGQLDPGEYPDAWVAPSEQLNAELTAVVLASTGCSDGPATVNQVSPGLSRSSWIYSQGPLFVVRGSHEATEMLTHKCMHADFLSIIESSGFHQGLVYEAARASLLSINGARHREYRSVVASYFTRHAAEGLRTPAQSTARALAKALVGRDQVEFVGEFAVPYIKNGLFDFFGFSAEEVESVTWAVDRAAWATKDLSNRRQAATEAAEALYAISRKAMSRQLGTNVSNPIAAVAEAVEAGRLPEMLGAGLVASMLSAGTEPTINQLGIMATELSHCETLWDDMGRGRQAISPVVEEVLRYRSTNPRIARRVNGNFVYRGVRFANGQRILVDTGAANRDPRRFSRPEQIDPDANRGTHLAFGHGPHFCLGAAVSRVQLQEALAILTNMFQCPRIVERVDHKGQGLFGPEKLVVRLKPREPV